jgi:tagatose 1,6-diphosphate aldolase
MTTKLTPGKLAGMKALSDKRGVIAAAAMDQRGSLKKSLAKEKGADVDDHALEEFKTLVTEVLTRHASAILLDPEYGLPAAKHRNGKGLLLAYEKTGYDATEPGRLPDLLDHWSVRRIQKEGANAVKVLLYYTPFEKKEINDVKHAFIERVGDECRAHDIAFFLEFVGYDAAAGDEKGIEYAKKKPEIVKASMAEFTKEPYGVDVLKVEVPVQMDFVAGTKASAKGGTGGASAYTREQALGYVRSAAEAATKPFIYLSAGVSNPVFIETLELAGESGANFNGVLCGRATWKDGIPVYAKQGAKAFKDWLENEGVKNIENVNRALRAATPWTERLAM